MCLRFPHALALAALLLLVGGCDEATTDLFTFPVNNVTFTFSFRSIDLDDAGAIEIGSQNTEDVLDAIRDQGFGPEDVASVELVEGEAQIRFLQTPVPGTNIGVLDDVSVRLGLPGSNESTEVASAEDIEASGAMTGEADLEVSSQNVASVLTAGEFDATLDVSVDDPDTLPAGTYLLEVRFDLEVGVQGF
jgi:hypothetical protein